MTLYELKSDTARLGFLPDVGDLKAFLACANRALLRVNSLRPRQKTVRLLHLTEANLLQESNGIVVATTPVSVHAKGARAYAFYGIGEGILRITVKDPHSHEKRQVGERVLSGEQFYEGGIFLDATPIPPHVEVTLTFVPVDLLQIEAPALYEMEMVERQERTTTSTEWYDYDLRRLCEDLLTCEGVCAIGGKRYRRGEILDGRRTFFADSEVVDAAALGITMPNANTVRIPMEQPGVYTLTYLCAPKPLTENQGQQIDLPSDLAALLPLACAAELFYEEDPEKSAFYLENLRKQAEQITGCTPTRSIPITDRTGW